jgi:hypothetical protein
MQRRLRGIALLGLSVVVFTIAGNWVGSFLLKHNSVYWLIAVVVFCLMRQVFNPYARFSDPVDPLDASLIRGGGAVFTRGRSTVFGAGSDNGVTAE